MVSVQRMKILIDHAHFRCKCDTANIFKHGECLVCNIQHHIGHTFISSFPTPTLYFTENGILWKKNGSAVREANGAESESGGQGEGKDPAAAQLEEEELRRERSVEVQL